MKGYLLRVLISFSQMGNALLGGRPDHTISGRVGYYSMKGKLWAEILERVIDTLFWFDPEHCKNSIEWDELKTL